MARLSSPLQGEAPLAAHAAFRPLRGKRRKDSSPCVEGSAFDANEGGGRNATDLARQLRQWTARQQAS